MLSRGTKRVREWTRRAIVVMMGFALLAALVLPLQEAHASVAPLNLNSPQDIKFYTYNGITEMYIADTGNNRVIRADMNGLANLILSVNNPTAVAVDEVGNIYAAESGLNASLHAFNRDGETLPLVKYNGEAMDSPIELISKMVTAVDNYPKLMNIKSLIVRQRTNTNTQQVYKEASFHFESYGITSYYPTTYGLVNSTATLNLNLNGSSRGSTGPGELGFALHSDGKVWESGGYFVSLESVFNMFPEEGSSTGEIAIDFVGQMFYVVVNKTKISRASYNGASYYNRPTLQSWLNLTDDYGISEPHALAIGPDNKLYVTDAAQNRIVVLNLDDTGTFNRVLSLTAELNDPPTAGSFMKRGKQGKAITLNGSDFLNHYSDPNGHAMKGIRIVTLPAHGTLSLAGIPVQAGQAIPVASLSDLAFTPDAAWGGTTFFEWLAGDNGGAYSETSGKVELVIGLKGDANGDGAVTPADALLITKYLKGKITLTADQLEALDMNEDGEVNETDAALIMNIYMGNAT
ncbi:dockerin type I domain-containing protein [Paenibacillus sp. KS-LC4]|uniref:dockerin type I domain-containing protein n=1 Tax=Paenibacillus sp. KS-LC4 TaxID=2979727 RepID=UPI0030D264EA